MNYVYLLRCADNTLYGGWTNNLPHRIAAHNTGKTGAKYTKSRRPVALVYCEAWETRSEAMRREATIKKLPRAEKEQLVASLAEEDDELLEIYDKDRKPCGVLPRHVVHRCGLLHCVVHLHVFQKKNGVMGVWLQQRSMDKKVSPGAYDWAATGHMDPGESPVGSVLREAREECGLYLADNCLQTAGERLVEAEHAPDLIDKEVAYLFFHVAESDPPFCAGPEVQKMVWASADDVTKSMKSGVPLPVITQSGEHGTIPAGIAPKNFEEWKQICRMLPTAAVQNEQDG